MISLIFLYNIQDNEANNACIRRLFKEVISKRRKKETLFCWYFGEIS